MFHTSFWCKISNGTYFTPKNDDLNYKVRTIKTLAGGGGGSDKSAHHFGGGSEKNEYGIFHFHQPSLHPPYNQ